MLYGSVVQVRTYVILYIAMYVFIDIDTGQIHEWLAIYQIFLLLVLLI